MRVFFGIVGVTVVVLGSAACNSARDKLPDHDGSAGMGGAGKPGTGGGAGTRGVKLDGGTAGIGTPGDGGPGTGGDAGSTVVLTPANIALDPLNKDFSTIVIGHYAEATFQVSNTGQAPTTGLTVSLDGADAAQYSISTNTCVSALDGGASCLVTVRFSPTAAGLKAARLTASATMGGAVTAMLQGTAVPAGALTVDPSVQSLGSVLKGGTGSPSTFTVTNTGGSPSGPLSTTISDSTEIALATDGCNGTTLAGGAKCTVTITLKPTSAGQKSATLLVTASPGGTASASLTGVGLAPALLAVTPAAATFADTVIGTTSAPQTFTISNAGGVAAGTSAALTAVLAVSSGTDASEFVIASNTCTGTLAPAATCSVAVTFKPMSAAVKTATLTASATPGGTASATLTGTALSPALLALTPVTGASADFGTVVTNTSASQSYLLSNNGQHATSALTIGATGTDFAISAPGTGDCMSGSTLAGGASCTIHVKFAPTTTGAKTSTLTASASTGGIQTLSLKGLAVAPGSLTLSPASQTFGAVLQNTSTAPITFTVTNMGGAATTALTTAVSGSSEFAITTDGCKGKTLAGGAQCTIAVTFAPTSGGQKAANLTVSAATGGTASSNLSGTGLTPASFTVTPTVFTFPAGTVSGTTAAAQSFTVTNAGGVASGTVASTIAGTDAGQFAISSSTCTTVAPGATCTISVVFKPTAAGTKTATLSLTASPGGSASATLNATALAAAKLTVAAASGSSNDFGSILVGNAALQTFVVTNAGQQATSTPLTISVSGTDFSVATPPATGDCASTTSLAPSASCVVRVQFKPSAAATRTGALSVNATTGGAATLAPGLTGIGVSPGAISITPLTQAFGSVQQGAPSASHSFTVTNTGGAATGALATSVSPTTDFAITSDGCKGKVLQAAGTCSVTVVMTPAAPAGSKTATLTVSANPGGSVSSSLTGSGFTPAVLALSFTTAAFGNVAVGTTKDLLFTLTNSGTQGAAGIAKTVTGSGFSLPTPTGAECGTTLAGSGATCSIRVRFTPPGLAGPVSGTLTVSATTGTTPSPVPLSANAYGILAVPLPAGTTNATFGGMDGAGHAIVGMMQTGDTFGFYWVIGTSTVTTIPPVPGETDSGSAHAISSNGSVVTGLSNAATPWSWTPGSTSSRSLGAPTTKSMPPRGIDGTGGVIVGSALDFQAGVHQGFVWRSATGGGFEFMGDLGTQDVIALGVSDNGRIVGTQSDLSSGNMSGVIWTTSSNVTSQPGTTLPGNISALSTISGDGTVIIGCDANNFGIKWTSPFTGQPQSLPNLSVATGSVPLGLNQTGAVIVGLSTTQTGGQLATAWTPTPVDIAGALAGAPNVTSFSLDSASAVSSDGKIFAGDGSFKGVRQPWVARLP